MIKEAALSTPSPTTAGPGSRGNQTASSAAKPSIVILYTTKYREGGEQFAVAAQTLADLKRKEFPGSDVLCRAVESKKEFVEAFEAVASRDEVVDELHFIGHS